MSEFSDSYHIRTDDPAKTKSLLRKARLAGVVFGPANGWLTFVPYEDLNVFRQGATFEGFTRELSRVLETTVLHYSYGEDHGWSFALTGPGKSVSRFACWWDPEPAIERDRFDQEALASLAPTVSFAALLQQFDVSTAAVQKPSYRFAELLGLPAYKWLSPHLAQHHTDDLIAQGGSKLGTKPRNAVERLHVPPARKLVLPRPDLSAREAFDIVEPFVSKLQPEWHLAEIFGNGRVKSDGRLDPSVGAWQFTYRKNTGVDFIYASLYFSGNLGFHGQTAPGYIATSLPPALALPNDWLDSSDIAKIVGREPIPAGLSPNYSLVMRLRPEAEIPLIWDVTRHFVMADRRHDASDHLLAVDAKSGDIVFETFERKEGGKLVEARQRLRWQGGDWEEIQIPD